VKVEAAAQKCVDILVALVDGKAEYAIEEAVIVVADILRRFPGSFESVIAKVCQNFQQSIREPRAKGAAIWMLGEYCRLIENVDTLLDPFLDTFHDEQVSVQLHILTAIVKCYVADPARAKDQLQFVLNEATKGGVVPDVRNRAFIYWRLLSTTPETYERVINVSKRAATHSGVRFNDAVLSELIRNMGSVAGVLHVVPSDFVARACLDESSSDAMDDVTVRQWTLLPFKESGGHCEVWVDWEPTSMHVRIVSTAPEALTELAVAVNRNALGLGFAGVPAFLASLGRRRRCASVS